MKVKPQRNSCYHTITCTLKKHIQTMAQIPEQDMTTTLLGFLEEGIPTTDTCITMSTITGRPPGRREQG